MVAALAAALIATIGLAGPASATGGVGTNVVGGEPAAPGEYGGFMVSLQAPDESGTWRHFCGGSVRNRYQITTAAHCLPAGQNPPANELENIRVVAGIDRLSDTSRAQFRTVDTTWQHPQFGKEPGFDVGTITLRTPLENVSPVTLPTPGTDALLKPGSKATVIGWGATSDGGVGADELMRADVPILDQDECTVADEIADFNPDTDMCAGVRGKDSCQGDSGGPLIKVLGEGASRKVYQIGIVSRGAGCAGQGAPGVYTYTGSAAIFDQEGRSAE